VVSGTIFPVLGSEFIPVEAFIHTVTNGDKQGHEYRITPNPIVRESTGAVADGERKRKP